MSAHGFRVQVQELADLASRLDECTAQMRKANDRLKNASANDLGNIWVDSACESFQDAWGYGIGLIERTTESIRDGLHSTARAYNATEQAIHRMFHNRESGSTTPSPGKGTPFG